MLRDRLSDEIAAYARAIAPQVERLVHAGWPAARALLPALEPPHDAILIAVSGPLLAGAITLDDLVALERDAPRATLAAALEEYARRGLVARAGVGEETSYAPTMRGRDLLLRVTAQQGAAVTALWAPCGDILPDLVSIATRVVGVAAATLPLTAYPAFRVQQAVPDPLGAPLARLLIARLAALRALRADVTAAVWGAHGFDAAQARALVDVCCAASQRLHAEDAGVGHDEDDPAGALATLHSRRLVGRESGQWHITASGRTLHASIEQEIDERAAQPFAAVEAPARAVFLRGLKRLPG